MWINLDSSNPHVVTRGGQTLPTTDCEINFIISYLKQPLYGHILVNKRLPITKYPKINN